MKKLFAFSLIALAALAVSCNKNEQIAPEATDSARRTFTCTFVDTKMSIDNTAGNEGKTGWEVGDQILIHGQYTSEGYCEVITLTSDNISTDHKTATFTLGDITVYDRTGDGYKSNLYAQYPADAVVMDDQCYWNSRFNEGNAPLMVGYNNGNTFVMYHITGILSFVVNGDFDTYKIKGNGGETVGYSAVQSRIRLKSNGDENKDGFPLRLSGDDFTSVALTDLTADVIADGVTENRIFIPGGVKFTGGFTIEFSKGGTIKKTLSTTSNVEIAVGAYRPMGNITSYLKDYVAPSSHNSSIPFTADDALDVSGTANCYVVPVTTDGGGKVYTFKAYKGNTKNGVGVVKSVSILWETYNNTDEVTEKSVIAAVDYDKQDANDFYTIVFKMPATLHAGNALIAAKDKDGNILWSWHIWVPSNEISIVTEEQYSTKNIMSRNLGALVDAVKDAAAPVESFGLLYEWGRKDPFPGLGVTSGSTPATVAGTAITYQEQRMTIEESTLNPTVYVYVVNSWTPEATATTDDGVLWGETTKTIYDPCPVGYMLPKRLSTSFWDKTNMATVTGFTYSVENRYFAIGDFVCPLTGYIDNNGEGHKRAGERSLLWSGRWDSGTENGYGFFADATAETPSFARSAQKRTRGGSVRCVAE